MNNKSDFLENFKTTDKEFYDFFKNFLFDEVKNSNDLDDKSRYLAIIATLLGSQSIDLFREILPTSLKFLTPDEIKETVYQATAYLGIGRVFPFLKATNEIFTNLKIKLPLEEKSTTTPENRVEKGNAAQVTIFGDRLKDFYLKGPEETRHINRFLAGNCFGDYYTRKGLDLKQREMITFCIISAQGGCEPQLTSHAVGNMRIGNDRLFLIKVLTQCLPYIGYPRSLNALRCINSAQEQLNKA